MRPTRMKSKHKHTMVDAVGQDQAATLIGITLRVAKARRENRQPDAADLAALKAAETSLKAKGY